MFTVVRDHTGRTRHRKRMIDKGPKRTNGGRVGSEGEWSRQGGHIPPSGVALTGMLMREAICWESVPCSNSAVLVLSKVFILVDITIPPPLADGV